MRKYQDLVAAQSGLEDRANTATKKIAGLETRLAASLAETEAAQSGYTRAVDRWRENERKTEQKHEAEIAGLRRRQKKELQRLAAERDEEHKQFAEAERQWRRERAGLKKRHEDELENINVRVRQTIANRDKVVRQLREQLQSAEMKIGELERLLRS